MSNERCKPLTTFASLSPLSATYVQRESRQRVYCLSSSCALRVSLSSSVALCVALSSSLRLVCFVLFGAGLFAPRPRLRRGGVRLRLVCFVLFFVFVVFAFGFVSRANCAQLLRHNFENVLKSESKVARLTPTNLLLLLLLLNLHH